MSSFESLYSENFGDFRTFKKKVKKEESENLSFNASKARSIRRESISRHELF